VVVFRICVKHNRKSTRYIRIGICITYKWHLVGTVGDRIWDYFENTVCLDPNWEFRTVRITIWRCCTNCKSVSSNDMALLCLGTKFNRFFGCYWCGRETSVPDISTTTNVTPTFIFSAKGSWYQRDVSIWTVMRNPWPAEFTVQTASEFGRERGKMFVLWRYSPFRT
jgi:hypothetical protein